MILIVSASNGANLDLAHALHALCAEIGLESDVVDLTEDPLPLYTPRVEAAGTPEGVDALVTRFSQAKGMIFCAPEYNGSLPPVLTNVVAWLSVAADDFRAVFNGKPAALATHSGGHGQKALLGMRTQLSHLGMNLVGREVQTNEKKPFRDSSGRAVIAQLHRMLRVS